MSVTITDETTNFLICQVDNPLLEFSFVLHNGKILISMQDKSKPGNVITTYSSPADLFKKPENFPHINKEDLEAIQIHYMNFFKKCIANDEQQKPVKPLLDPAFIKLNLECFSLDRPFIEQHQSYLLKALQAEDKKIADERVKQIDKILDVLLPPKKEAKEHSSQQEEKLSPSGVRVSKNNIFSNKETSHKDSYALLGLKHGAGIADLQECYKKNGKLFTPGQKEAFIKIFIELSSPSQLPKYQPKTK